LLVKLIHIEQKYPLIFIQHNEQIYIPDFNICTLLQNINSNINIQTIEDYVRFETNRLSSSFFLLTLGFND